MKRSVSPVKVGEWVNGQTRRPEAEADREAGKKMHAMAVAGHGKRRQANEQETHIQLR